MAGDPQWHCTCPVWGGLIPPDKCAWCKTQFVQCAPNVYPPPMVPVNLFASKLTDDDVERIARRVVELLMREADGEP